jgi:alpha-L-arabinofuranosidase
MRDQTYNASFYIQANEGNSDGSLSVINLSLRSNLIWATTSLPFSPGHNISTFDWQQFETTIETTATTPNSNNTFATTMNAEEVAGNVYYISLVSLLPPAYNARPNGIRQDLGEAVAGVNAKFLRFPGGNNLEGYSVAARWK